MGSGASVVQEDDLHALAAVQREYDRLTGRLDHAGDHDHDHDHVKDTIPAMTDEELFTWLRATAASQYDHETVREKLAALRLRELELEHEHEHESEVVSPRDECKTEGDVQVTTPRVVDSTADTGIKASPSPSSSPRQRPLPHPLESHASSSPELFDSLTQGACDGGRGGGKGDGDRDGVGDLGGGGKRDGSGRAAEYLYAISSSPSSLSAPSASDASASASAPLPFLPALGGRPTYDLTQNLTPVFTTDVLTDPATLKMMLNYCERHKIRNGVDLIRFWVEIDELALLPSHSYTNRRLRKIYDKFLSPEAPSPVCVTNNMRLEIEKALASESISAGIFTDAQAICLTALEQSVYPRFRDSKLFKKMQEYCAPAVPSSSSSGSHGSSSSSSNGSGSTAAATNGTVLPLLSAKSTRLLPFQQQQSQAPEPDDDFSLQGVLSDPTKLRFLKSFCMEALALENLLFYLEVEDCKRLPNLSFIANKTRRIYDRYCVATSRNFIQVDGTALRELHAAVENKAPLVPKLFYEAQLVAFGRISEEIWRGFSRTPEYLEYSRKLKPRDTKKAGVRRPRFATAEPSEQAQRRLEAMNEFQLIETAMHYPVVKLIPSRPKSLNAAPRRRQRLEGVDEDAGDDDGGGADGGADGEGDTSGTLTQAVLDGDGTAALAAAAATPVYTPTEQLATILGDPFAKRYFKQFMHKRGVDHYLAFCEEVEDFKLLPGIEYLQHSAKKIFRKYLLPTARLQVDISTSMRDEIAERLMNPSVDMFKKISMRVRQGMLQDSLPRFVKSTQYTDLKKTAKQLKDTDVEAELRIVDGAAKKGKLELGHLDILLQNQLCVKHFRLFLESQHCSENLMLWEEIEHFRRLPSYQIVLRSARKIYDKYLTASTGPGAHAASWSSAASSSGSNSSSSMRVRASIPLPDALHARVSASLDNASRTTFDEVEAECYDVMRNVVVPDFLDSRIFMALVGTWAIVDEDYPAEMLRGEFEMAFLRHRFHLVQETRGMSRDTSTPVLLAQTNTANTGGNGGGGGSS
ncbi:hypothetical protein PINS_up006618 [Pythium insidiosum]|nr:hypothetical protein PINS_up006618 [Pythium insidiosum]